MFRNQAVIAINDGCRGLTEFLTALKAIEQIPITRSVGLASLSEQTYCYGCGI